MSDEQRKTWPPPPGPGRTGPRMPRPDLGEAYFEAVTTPIPMTPENEQRLSDLRADREFPRDEWPTYDELGRRAAEFYRLAKRALALCDDAHDFLIADLPRNEAERVRRNAWLATLDEIRSDLGSLTASEPAEVELITEHSTSEPCHGEGRCTNPDHAGLACDRKPPERFVDRARAAWRVLRGES